ncbi:phage portal protein [Anaerococcus sp. NML200574]|uniref:phage portal protein n=1 Tax=Anaerococcus sp. NML200574 TaxID=2954486 RepID=UPI002238C7A0|nr:phage portal protein [Anaerococcus sp. NML200574]MCW6678170.1 phage portal protein [Anaerococcus sp. NML200574]
MFRTNKDKLSPKDVVDFIKKHSALIERYKKLQDYYLGNHSILEKGAADKDKDNKLVHPYPKYITDFNTGFFMGQSVKYVATAIDEDQDDKFLEQYQEVCNRNNEAKENLTLAKTCSIKGEAYELLWIDTDGNIRFKAIEPDNAFLIYDMSIEDKVKFGVRYFTSELNNKIITYAYLYDDSKVYFYSDENHVGQFELQDKEQPHPFKAVPLIHFKNNKELQGDFEQVISLIDAYNREQSNTLNDMDQFSDAYLALVNYGATNVEDVKKMNEERILLLDSDGDAKWVIKDVNDSWVENFKLRVNKDIHKFSFTPDFADESFGTNLPGISLRLKLLTAEELRNTKEMYFRESLTKRMTLIAARLEIANNEEVVRNQIQMQFSDSLPQNILELTQIVQNLSQDVSTETRLSLLPFIENPADEMEKKADEDQKNFDKSMQAYKNLGGHDEEEDLLAKEK